MLSPVEVSLQAHPQSVGVLPVVNEALWINTITQPRQTVYVQKYL